MKLRTKEALLDAVDEDFAWRKKEIATIKFLINRASRNPRLLSTALRAGVALLYAHWEGFLKSSSERYFEFISWQGLRNSDLADNLLAVVARRAINDLAASAKTGQGIAAVEFFRRRLAEPARMPSKDAIRTRSNLSSEVLRHISMAVGVSYSFFETKAALIDERLVAKRNSIAHGQFLDIDAPDFEDLMTEVTDMMEIWRNEIENACVTKRYTYP